MNNEFHTVRGYQLIRQNKMLLTSAMEDYLEMVYRNTEGGGYLRINELAEKLNVKAPSATKMVQKLGQLGLIRYKRYAIVELSELGKEMGAYLLYRHRIIEQFLMAIGIRENVLIETELIEHYISTNTLEHLEVLNRFLTSNPDIQQRFEEFLEQRNT